MVDNPRPSDQPGAQEREGEGRPDKDVRERLFDGSQKSEAHMYQALGLVAQLGLVVAICVGAGLAGGFLLDRLLGWSGPLTAAGVLVGVAAGFYAAGKLLFRENKGAHRDGAVDDRHAGAQG